MIIREKYLDWLRGLQDKKLIKVITGVRRCGKSTLLQSFRDDLRSRGVKKAQIQAYNFEELQDDSLTTWQDFHRYIEDRLVATEMNYIFLDEVQLLDGFERMIASLATKENVDLYITGSNAFLLSSELATLLTGRYISIHLLPYSFAEYRQAFPEDIHTRDLFERYLTESSFPEAVGLAKENQYYASDYISDIYNTIIERDIMTRYNLRNRTAFNQVMRFICSSIGSPVSARSISSALVAERIQISPKTILQYLNYLSNSYLIYPVNRYDIRGKKLFSTSDKFYLVDLGLRDIILGSQPDSDLGHRLENIVYLELLRRKEGRVYIGRQDNLEVDFVVEKPRGEHAYYQVSYTVADNITLQRELAPLQKIRDNFPKTIITHDTIPENFEGIEKVNIVDWLLKQHRGLQ